MPEEKSGMNIDLQLFADGGEGNQENNESKNENEQKDNKNEKKDEKSYTWKDVVKFIEENDKKKQEEAEKRKKQEEEEKEILEKKEKEDVKKYFEEKRKEIEKETEKKLFNEKLDHKIELTLLKKGLSEEQSEKVLKYLNKDSIEDVEKVESAIDEIIEDFNIYSEKDQETKQKTNSNFYRAKNGKEEKKESLGARLAKNRQQSKDSEEILNKYFGGGNR